MPTRTLVSFALLLKRGKRLLGDQRKLCGTCSSFSEWRDGCALQRCDYKSSPVGSYRSYPEVPPFVPDPAAKEMDPFHLRTPDIPNTTTSVWGFPRLPNHLSGSVNLFSMSSMTAEEQAARVQYLRDAHFRKRMGELEFLSEQDTRRELMEEMLTAFGHTFDPDDDENQGKKDRDKVPFISYAGWYPLSSTKVRAVQGFIFCYTASGSTWVWISEEAREDVEAQLQKLQMALNETGDVVNAKNVHAGSVEGNEGSRTAGFGT